MAGENEKGMTLFLTGATGFIGGALLRRLLDPAEAVHLLVRPGSSPALDHPKVRVFRGGLDDLAVLKEGMRGCDAVFHLAAWVRTASDDRLLFDRINVEGTRRIIEAASSEKVRRVVYTSSVVAIGPSNGTVADEKTVRRTGFLTDYERSKALAEEEMTAAARDGFPAVIVSPSLVFGPTDSLKRYSFNKFLLDFIAGRLTVLPGDGKQVVNAVYIDDVVEGHLLALEKGRIGERYILGGENISLDALSERVIDLLKKNRRPLHLPLPLLKGLSWIEWGLSTMLRKEPRITPKSIAMYRHDWAYSSDKAKAELGYRPIPLDEGIRKLVDWAPARMKMDQN
ncbi:MAG TPA: NAD-dependent epimerase/dehydratase family protein [Candidatus Manganitrophaceae bacterium]|nr:NAD-dependent epimerase/dehydratase family protein [Candidatus Manganitrophaceae bacterium]